MSAKDRVKFNKLCQTNIIVKIIKIVSICKGASWDDMTDIDDSNITNFQKFKKDALDLHYDYIRAYIYVLSGYSYHLCSPPFNKIIPCCCFIKLDLINDNEFIPIKTMW